jgi:hypothetical protein
MGWPAMMNLARMNRSLLVLLIALPAAACSKGGSSEKSLDGALFGKVPAQPPGDLGKLKVGMPIEEAKKAAPHLVPKDDDYDSFDSGYKDLRFAVGIDKERTKITRLRMELPKNGKEMLVAAWGPGQDGDCSGHPCTYWFDPGTQMRAVLEPSYRDDVGVEFAAYTPFEKLLGKPAALAFETKPILGSTVEELKATYPTLFREELPEPGKAGDPSYWLEVPPTGYDKFWTRIAISFDATKRVDRVWMTIEYRDYPPGKAEMIATIEKAWGKGAETKDITGAPHTMWHDGAGRRVELDTSYDGMLQLDFTAYLPLAKLLGEGDALGFETSPIIGATWADLEKAYPQYVATVSDEEAQKKRKELENFMGEDKDKLAVLGEAKGGTSFNLPGTEWAPFTMIHLSYDEAQKVRSYSFGISYREGSAAAKDEIKAALEKKWGAPKVVDKYGQQQLVFREAGPRIVVEDDDIMKDWSIEVGGAP